MISRAGDGPKSSIFIVLNLRFHLVLGNRRIFRGRVDLSFSIRGIEGESSIEESNESMRRWQTHPDRYSKATDSKIPIF